MISSSEYGGVLFVVLCDVVWYLVLLRCSFDSDWNWKIDYSIKDSGVNVVDPDVGIMSLYVINLDVVSLFADLSFMFLTVLNDVLYQFEWINIVLFLSKKNLLINVKNTLFLIQYLIFAILFWKTHVDFRSPLYLKLTSKVWYLHEFHSIKVWMLESVIKRVSITLLISSNEDFHFVLRNLEDLVKNRWDRWGITHVIYRSSSHLHYMVIMHRTVLLGCATDAAT
jgi:hypothetical protein